MTTDPNVHEQVSQAYTEALRRSEAGGTGCCGPLTTPAGAAAQLAGYDLESDSVPSNVAQSSFGCGNPLAFAGVRPGETVLDLGSGAGLDLLIAAEKVGASGRVIGVDMTDAMIEKARENIASAGATNVEVRKGIIEQLPVEDGSVDWVISNCVINLATDKPQVFREIARVLKPGGHFSISDIVVEELPDWLRSHAAAYSACVGGAISEADYSAGLAAAGLTEIEVTERFVYDAPQLQAIIGSDFDNLGVPHEEVDRAISETTGKVWSAKFSGRR